MNAPRSPLALCISALILSVVAQLNADAQPALSLKEARAQDAQSQSLAEQVAYTNSVCGLSMSAEVDWGSAAAWPEGSGLITQCDLALGAIESSCRAGAPKADITSLSRFICAGDGSGPSIRGRTFRFGAARGADSFERTRAFIDGLR